MPLTAAACSEESAPEPPAGTVSVTIKSDCKDTVKVFFGDKPKLGSGKNSTVSSSSRSNDAFKPGDLFWVVDALQNGVASATVGDGTEEIAVSCTSMSAR